MNTTDFTTNDEWERKELTFKILSEKDYDRVESFCEIYFYREEPISRSIFRFGENSMADNFVMAEYNKEFILPTLTNGTSILVLDKTERIVGLCLGSLMSSSEASQRRYYYYTDAFRSWCEDTISQFLPALKSRLHFKQKFLDSIPYGLDSVFTQLKNSNCVYELRCLCSIPGARGWGLGAEMARRVIELAKKRTCDHVYVLATDVHSQRIFQTLDFNVIAEREYSDFRDKTGREVFQRARPNTKVQVLAFKLEYI